MAGPGRGVSPRYGPVHSGPFVLGPGSGRRRQPDMNPAAGAGERGDTSRPRRAVAGLYAITPEEADTERLACKVQAALAGGASLVQYRSKSPDAALRRAQGERLLGVCRRAGAPLIVNDDLELALAIGADGVHLGRDDGDVAGARAGLRPARLLPGPFSYPLLRC